MCQCLNLNDFFQRTPVPIGQRDRDRLEEIYFRNDGKRHTFTHWLIALMWHEDETSSGWKTIIYPVAEGRVFWVIPPLFCTSAPATFEKAWRLSEAIKASSCIDRLTEHYVHPYWDDWEKV